MASPTNDFSEIFGSTKPYSLFPGSPHSQMPALLAAHRLPVSVDEVLTQRSSSSASHNVWQKFSVDTGDVVMYGPDGVVLQRHSLYLRSLTPQTPLLYGAMSIPLALWEESKASKDNLFLTLSDLAAANRKGYIPCGDWLPENSVVGRIWEYLAGRNISHDAETVARQCAAKDHVLRLYFANICSTPLLRSIVLTSVGERSNLAFDGYLNNPNGFLIGIDERIYSLREMFAQELLTGLSSGESVNVGALLKKISEAYSPYQRN